MQLFIGILFVVVAIFASVALIPPYWANYQFEDAIKTEALMATNSTKTEDAIRDTVYKRAVEYGVPLEKEKINGERQLTNEQFVAKAPAQVVEKLRARAAELRILVDKIRKKFDELGYP